MCSTFHVHFVTQQRKFFNHTSPFVCRINIFTGVFFFIFSCSHCRSLNEQHSPIQLQRRMKKNYSPRNEWFTRKWFNTCVCCSLFKWSVLIDSSIDCREKRKRTIVSASLHWYPVLMAGTREWQSHRAPSLTLTHRECLVWERKKCTQNKLHTCRCINTLSICFSLSASVTFIFLYSPFCFYLFFFSSGTIFLPSTWQYIKQNDASLYILIDCSCWPRFLLFFLLLLLLFCTHDNFLFSFFLSLLSSLHSNYCYAPHGNWSPIQSSITLGFTSNDAYIVT